MLPFPSQVCFVSISAHRSCNLYYLQLTVTVSQMDIKIVY